MPIKAVIFDLDGTIAVFNLEYKVMRAEVRGYLLKMGIPASLLEVNESVFEMLKKTELYLKNKGKNSDFMEEIRSQALAIAERYELEAAQKTSLLPGALDTLKLLRQRNLKIGLCTVNDRKSMDYILKRFQIAQFFDATVPRDRVNHVKPSPEHIQTTINALGEKASETLVVGDSVMDMQSAKEAKAMAVGLPTGVSAVDQLTAKGANYIITSITDLPQLVDKINKSHK